MIPQRKRLAPGLLALALGLFAGQAALAQDASLKFGDGGGDPNAPVQIQSDSLAVSQDDGAAVFRGNVVIQQDSMKLSAAEVTVEYDQTGQDIKSLHATGGVTLVSGTDAAEAQAADYAVGTGKITMKGKVLLARGNSTIAADTMIFDVDAGTADIQGNVRTLLQQQKAKK